MFILIEGGDAAGKTSTIESIRERIRSAPTELFNPENTIILKSPTSPFSEIWREIDKNPNIDTLTRYYFFRTAIQNDVNTVNRYLKNGFNVILERYIYSTEAFNVTLDKLRPVEDEDYKCQNHLNYRGILKPDLGILLDVSDQEREKRIIKRVRSGKKLSWWESASFQHDLNQHLKTIAEREGLICVDSEHNSIHEVTGIIMELMHKKKKEKQKNFKTIDQSRDY